MTEWRQDAVSFLRPQKDYKATIRIELEHRHPELQYSLSLNTDEGDYRICEVAE